MIAPHIIVSFKDTLIINRTLYLVKTLITENIQKGHNYCVSYLDTLLLIKGVNYVNIIRELRTKSGITQDQLGKVLNVQKSAISKYELGRAQPSPDVLKKLSEYFGVTTDYLLGRSNKPMIEIFDYKDLPKETKKIPIIGSVKCGPDGLAIQYLDGYVSVNDDLAEGHVALRCRGDSMTGEGIYDGDTVIVHLQETVESGQLAVVIVNGDEGTLKRVRTQKNMIILESANYAYPSRVFVGEEMNLIRIFGRVIEIRRTVK